MKKEGLCFHVHHEVLYERCWDYEGRKDYIKEYKPKDEIELRLRLFQPIQNLPQVIIEASAELNKASAEHDKASAEYDKARVEYNKASAELNKASAEHDKAYAEYDKAYAEFNKVLFKHKEELEKLHNEQCPNCPWDGKTIFPN